MMTTTYRTLLAALLVSLLGLTAQAFDTGRFASTSRLASGKWVKVAIPTSGVYQITDAQLRQMGFSNPANVRVYGWGGNLMDEVLSADLPDDLPQVPVLRHGDKICFYANGPVNFTFEPESKVSSATLPRHFDRTINHYTTSGYYFLGETGDAFLGVEEAQHGLTGSIDRATSLNALYHETERLSYGSGRAMLGESILDGPMSFDLHMPDRVPGSPLTVGAWVGACTNDVSMLALSTTFGGSTDVLTLPTATARIYAHSALNDFYNAGYAVVSSTPSGDSVDGRLTIGIDSPSKMSSAEVDYFVVTYEQNNLLAGKEHNQLLMAITDQTPNDRIVLPGASATTRVWNIDNNKVPREYPLAAYSGGRAFVPLSTRASTIYVAFDPANELMTVTDYETVDNQNLHAMTVPDLLIISNRNYLQQAERIAALHRQVEGIDVAVACDKAIFNEFSSGTPDGMAFRQLCKMLWDRDNVKFKNLLIMGAGTYDNRGLQGNRDNFVLTYQSVNSDNIDRSYTCDDFFGHLDDGSGSDPTRSLLRIGVGRINSADVDEAKSDVDKLYEYYLADDFGEWHNNALITADRGDNDLHIFQADGVNNLINPDLYTDPVQPSLNTGMHTEKVYNGMYAFSTQEPSVSEGDRTASNGRDRWHDVLASGVYFGTYVGHADVSNFTKGSHMWTTTDVMNTKYDHFPIFSTACCDVAPYDSGNRGIADRMLHQRHGGAIALLTAARQVYADHNDRLNVAFVKALFSYDATGKMPTLGEAYKEAKQYNGTASNYNKMSFCLLGDPAIQVNYPKPQFKITKVNSTAVNAGGSLTIYPLQQLDIEARVYTADGSAVDTGFAGDATVTLYDVYNKFLTTGANSYYGVRYTRDVYYSRNVLAKVNGRVEGGVFKGSVIVPRYCNTGRAMLQAFAHRDHSRDMVNGVLDKDFTLTLTTYDAAHAVADTEAPEVKAMFINDAAAFVSDAVVPSTCTLHITATDNVSINTQTPAVTSGMSLLLDGGRRNFTNIARFARIGDGGKTVTIDFPLNDLLEGRHTLSFGVSDAAGNTAYETIEFVVGDNHGCTLTASETVATDRVDFNFESTLATVPDVTVKVTDAAGRLVWSDIVTSFPHTWNLRDNSGNRLPTGLYHYHATFNNGTLAGSTTRGKLVIVKQ